MTLSTFAAAALGMILLAILDLGPPRTLGWLAALCLGLALLAKATPAFCVLAVLALDRAFSLPAERWRIYGRAIAVLFVAAALLAALAVYFEHQHERDVRIPRINGVISADDGYDPLRATTWQTLDHVTTGVSLATALAAVAMLVVQAVRAGLGPLRRLPLAGGLAAALLIGLWWYAALVALKGWPEFQRLLSFEIAQRVAGGIHREPMHYYLPLLFTLAFPASIGLLSAIGVALPALGRGEALSLEQRADRFLLAWIAGVTLFFSIPGAKLATYLLPAFPALALLIARYIVRWSSNQVPAWAARVTYAVAGLAFLATLVCGLLAGHYPDDFERFLRILPVPFIVVSAPLGLALAALWWRMPRQPLLATSLLAVFTVGFVLALFPYARPVFLDGRSQKPLCERIRAELNGCDRVASVGATLESLSYYLDCTVHESRRRRVRWRTEPGQKPVTEDEPFDAVIREELARPEKVALLVQRRYYARMLNIRMGELPQSDAELIKTVPPYARFVAADEDLVVLRNLR